MWLCCVSTDDIVAVESQLTEPAQRVVRSPWKEVRFRYVLAEKMVVRARAAFPLDVSKVASKQSIPGKTGRWRCAHFHGAFPGGLQPRIGKINILATMGTPLPTRNGSGSGFGTSAALSESPSNSGKPTVDDLRGNNTYARIAQREWLEKTTPQVQAKVVDEVWNLLDKDGFPFRDLLVLENEQMLEQYLWPGYTEDASNHHILLLALLVNVKRREGLPSWGKRSIHKALMLLY